MTKSLPKAMFDTLSERGKKLCAEVVMNDEKEDYDENAQKTSILYQEHLECYKSKGLTDDQIEEFKGKGLFVSSIGQVPIPDKKKDTLKDEL